MFSDLFQATQLDSERQQNSNAGVTPNCPRAAPEEEQGAAGHPHKTRPPHPAPPRPCVRPPSPSAWVVGRNPRGPGLVWYLHPRNHFLLGPARKVKEGVEMGPPRFPPRPPPPPTWPAAAGCAASRTPGRSAGTRRQSAPAPAQKQAGRSDLSHRPPGQARWGGGRGTMPTGNANARDRDGSWLSTSLVPRSQAKAAHGSWKFSSS